MRQQGGVGRHLSVQRLAVAVALFAAIACGSRAGAQDEPLRGDRLTEGAEVLSAFTDVVAPSRTSTVRVLVDGRHVALGTIVDSSGWILSKSSQLQGAITCRLSDGREFPAECVARDSQTDLALLKVDAAALPAIHWHAGDDPGTGQWLATPGDDSVPVGVGIVSVVRREIPPERISGVLGVRLEDLDGPARIREIIEDSAAAAAGLQPGDLVKRVGDDEIASREALVRLIRDFEPGTTLNITIQRGDSELVVPATLTHPFGQFLSRIAAQNHMGGPLSRRRSGFPAVLQHDTVLGPEDCGGPVVDLDGEAIGINIARAGRTETYALPADIVIAAFQRMRGDSSAPEKSATPTVDAEADMQTVNDVSTQ